MDVILLGALGVANKLILLAMLLAVLFGGFMFMVAGAQAWQHDTLMESFYFLGGAIGCGIIRPFCIRLSMRIAE